MMSVETCRKIKAVLLVAILGMAEVHEIRRDVRLTSGLIRDGRGAAKKSQQITPFASYFVKKVEAMLGDSNLQEQRKLVSKQMQLIKAMMASPNLKEQTNHFSKQIESSTTEPKLQENVNDFLEKLEAVIASPYLQEHAKLFTKQIKLMTADPKLQENMNQFEFVRKLEAMMASPNFQKQALHQGNWYSQPWVDIMADKLTDRVLKGASLRQTGLDKATLGKPSELPIFRSLSSQSTSLINRYPTSRFVSSFPSARRDWMRPQVPRAPLALHAENRRVETVTADDSDKALEKEAPQSGGQIEKTPVIKTSSSQVENEPVVKPPANAESLDYKLLKVGLAILIYVGTSVLTFSNLEGWSIADSLYFSIVTLTTVGYGDLAPQNPASRLFESVWSIFALLVVAAQVGDYAEEAVQMEVKNEQARKALGMKQDTEIGIFDESGQENQWRAKLMKEVIFITALFAVGTVFAKTLLKEDWIDALYSTSMTLTTIGYGDVVPTTEEAKYVFSALIFFGVPLFGAALARIGSIAYGKARSESINTIVGGLTDKKFSTMLEFSETMKQKGAYNSKPRPKGEAQITPFDFLCFILIKNEVVNMDDIKAIMENFSSLDVHESGLLEQNDVEEWLRRGSKDWEPKK